MHKFVPRGKFTPIGKFTARVKLVMLTHLSLGIKFAHVDKIALLKGRGKFAPRGILPLGVYFIT